MSWVDVKALSARNDRARRALMRVVFAKDLDEAKRIAGAELGLKCLGGAKPVTIGIDLASGPDVTVHHEMKRDQA